MFADFSLSTAYHSRAPNIVLLPGGLVSERPDSITLDS